MKRTLLLVVKREIADEVFEALDRLGDAAGLFGDNGGWPDGHGPLLAPVKYFSPEELTAACAAGAVIRIGWETNNYEGGDPYIPYPWCGYGVNGKAYALSRRALRALEKACRED